MAILIPDVPKDCNYSERQVYERLGRELPAEWIVFHSLGLAGHESKIWGEADIVVLSTKGIFALEVKGGRVECREGVWHFGEGSKSYTKKEDPWTQSKGTMVAIRKLLKGADPQFENILFGFGVVMPREHFTAKSAEIIPEVLLDKREYHLNIGRYISALETYWAQSYVQKFGRDSQAPTLQQVRLARKLLRPNIESAFSIGGYLSGMDSQLLQLSNDQIRASRRIAANPRTVVRGPAGTGKTVIAVERAKQLAKLGTRVVYLCFNKLLAGHVRRSLEDSSQSTMIDVYHVHALYADVILKAGMQKRLDAHSVDDPEYYSRIFPEIFVDAAIETGLKAWDVLVVDEAQDLLTPHNMDAFDIIVRDGLTQGKWHFFMDPKQNIYSTLIQGSVEQRLAAAYPTFDDLVENCRNTKQVAVQASIISGIDLALQGAPDGESCENIYYSGRSDFLKQIDALVSRFLQHDVPPKDIAILSTRRRENSLIAGIQMIGGCSIEDANNDAIISDDALVFSTMHAFKGLERPIVIAIDMDEIGIVRSSMLHYAGLSRACAILRTFLPSRCTKVYATQAKAFAERLSF